MLGKGSKVITSPTRHKFHDDINGMFVRTHSDQLDNIGVIILLQDVGLLEELPPGGGVHGLFTCLHRHLRPVLLPDAAEDIAKVTLGKI